MPMQVIQSIQAHETYDLRHRILRPHQHISSCRYLGDEEAIHLGLFDPMLISIISLFKENSSHFPERDQWRFRGMATDSAYQKKGYGYQILSEAIHLAKNKKISLLWCNARKDAFPFYEKLGFHRMDELFEIEDIGPHSIMWKRI